MQNQSKVNHIIRTMMLSLSIIALTFTTACNNDPDDTPTPTPQTCKMSKIIITAPLASDNRTGDITYNADFKITSITTTIVGEPTITSTYTYLPNGRIKVIDSREPNNYTEYELNSAGNVQTKYEYNQGNLYTTQYEYNTEGYRTKLITDISTTTYTYENGNLKRLVSTYNNSTFTSTAEYEYAGALIANSFWDINDETNLIPSGKNSKNLFTKITSYSSSNPTPSTTNFSYVIDSNNRVTKMTIGPNTSDQEVLDFSYTCR